jgi:geranylgeranyl pyrophosphate synthase
LERGVIISQELDMVEAALLEAVGSDVELLCEASKYVIRAGGKRLRPKVVLLSFRAAGGQDVTQAVPLAAAVELLHTASLIHDDISDHSSMRRGQETVSARWGNGLALLIGDFVFVKLLSLVAAFDSRIVQVVAKCCVEVVEGETSQMLHAGNTRMSETDYLEIVSQKTGSLISACGELGGILAGGTERQVRALRDYGHHLGIAFQIRDDTLDLIGDSGEMGKPVTADLEQGKVNLAVLFAIRESERKGQRLSLQDVQRAPRILHESGALDYALRTASQYAEEAKKALAVLPASEAKEELCKLADFAIARNQ